MTRPTTGGHAAPPSRPRPRRRRALLLLVGVLVVAVVATAVVRQIWFVPDEQRDRALRSAEAACVTQTASPDPLGTRFAECRTKVDAWVRARDGDTSGLHRAVWMEGATYRTDSPATRRLLSTSGDPIAAASGFTAALGSRPQSGAVTCRNRSNVTITGRTFRGIGADVPAITIDGCHHVRIVQNDFLDDAEPIYVTDSTDVVIEYNRYRNITGPHERNGSHRGNFTQWERSTGGSISHNVGVGGDTEDIVSVFQSGGRSASSPLVIADNWFQGTNWSSDAGSGILLGDGGGRYVVVKDNVLVNPGQVGIGVAGGRDIRVTNNTIVGQARTHSNVGIYVWAQGTACSAIEVSRNTVDFVKRSGKASGGFDHGNCGRVVGWDTNRWSADLKAGRLGVEL